MNSAIRGWHRSSVGGTVLRAAPFFVRTVYLAVAEVPSMISRTNRGGRSQTGGKPSRAAETFRVLKLNKCVGGTV
jgi:hypothetical protein